MLVGDIMTETVISISPDNAVRHAAQLMLDHHVSGLPVLDDNGKLAGMLTEGDLLRRAELGLPTSFALASQGSGDFIKSHSWRVGDIMTSPVITVDENMSIGQLAATMCNRDIKRAPVMRGDRLVGIVSRADILRGLATAPRESVATGDDAIRRAVSTRLQTELNFNPGLASVTVSDGNVHLWGRVPSENDRRAAQIVAETVEGVRGVTNSLHIIEVHVSDLTSEGER